MISRRFLLFITLTTTATLFFMLGVWHAQNGDALDRETYAASLDAIRAEVRSELGRPRGFSVFPRHISPCRDESAGTWPHRARGGAARPEGRAHLTRAA